MSVLCVFTALWLCGCGKNTTGISGEHGTVAGTLTPTAIPTDSPTPTATPSPTVTPTFTPSLTPTLPPEDLSAPEFKGTAYVVTNGNGEVVLAKNAQQQLYPASTIKMLTALTAMDYATMDTLLTAKADQLVIDADVYKYGGYTEGVVEGMTYPLREWMHMLLISSCGDAANVIAGNIGGTIDHFLELMNQKALELGMTHTHVDNPIGLDIGNGFENITSTAEDMSRLAYAFYQNKELLEIAGKAQYQVPDCEQMKGKLLKNSNSYLLQPTRFHSDYFEAIGSKSGSTKAAGNCFVITAVGKDDAVYIISVFGAPYGTLEARDGMFDNITAILEYCFKNKK